MSEQTTDSIPLADTFVFEGPSESGLCSATFYAWKSKFGGMEASDIKRMRDLEHENSLLKKCMWT